MSYVSLFDALQNLTFGVEGEGALFHLEERGAIRTLRLPRHSARVLEAMFEAHPRTLTYDAIGDILRAHHLHISDNGRIHRHMNELRRRLEAFDGRLKSLLENARGAGYTLCVGLQQLDVLGGNQDADLFEDADFGTLLKGLHGLITSSIALMGTLRVVPHPLGFVLDREAATSKITNHLTQLETLHGALGAALSLHPHDLIALRLDALVAKLATYVGMARLCAYPISHAQWSLWYTQEIGCVFADIKKCVRFARFG